METCWRNSRNVCTINNAQLVSIINDVCSNTFLSNCLLSVRMFHLVTKFLVASVKCNQRSEFCTELNLIITVF